MRFLFLTSIIACGSVTAIKNCKEAKAAVESYKKLRVASADSMVFNPLIEAEKEGVEQVRYARKSLLVDAADALIESKAPYWEPKENQCGRVLDAFKCIEKMETGKTFPGQIAEAHERWNIVISRITVLLGGRTLPQEKTDVVLRLGSRMFELLRRSRVIIFHVSWKMEENFSPTILGELKTLLFFQTHGKDIANKLLNGLDTFENGLKYWEQMRGAAAATRKWRMREMLFRSYPPGYVLGAICEVTSIASEDLRSANKYHAKYFGRSFTTVGDVVDAISPLADFSIFSDTNWMKQLGSEGMRDLLRGISVADFILQGAPYSWLKENYGGFTLVLPGIVFMRWITGNYDTRDYKGTKRLALAARTAKRAVKLTGLPPSKQTPIHDMVLAFLDVGSDDIAMLEKAFAWVNSPFVSVGGPDTKFAASYLNNYVNQNGMTIIEKH